jgi:predicted site-specific integrase-resolvase
LADQDLLVTRHEAARRAGVTFNTILLWIRAGRLHPVVEPGPGRRTLKLSEVDSVVRETRAAARRTLEIWSVSSGP